MKKIIIIILIVLTNNIFSQEDSTQTIANITPGGYFDNVSDQNGRKYPVKNLEILVGEGNGAKVSPTNTCQAGIFKFFFSNSSGMAGNGVIETARRNTICHLGENISALLGWNGTWPTNGYVKILVDSVGNYVNNPASSGVRGLSATFYAYPINPSNQYPGVIRNQIEKTIISKVDAWTNVINPLNIGQTNANNTVSNGYYHGVIAFNFANSTIQWCSSHLNTPTPSQDDLYGVALHELTHSLGFAALISSTGVSVFSNLNNYYSKYDTYLYSSTHVKLVSTTNSCSAQYGLSFGVPTSYLQPGCSSTYLPDNTVCNLSCLYSNLSSTVNVYTPSCWEQGSSLSHFEDMCYPYPTSNPSNNNQYFVMANSSAGFTGTKRYLKQEERNVLCDLGYSVATTYTSLAPNATYTAYTGSCTAIAAWGINDGLTNGVFTFTGSSGGSAAINVTLVSSNDAPNTVPSCVESVYNNGIAGMANGVITFTPNSATFVGPFLLRYVPKLGSIEGNVTYIFGYMLPAGCSPISPCDIVQNGGFELNNNCGSLGNTVTTSCWYPYTSSPDLCVRNCTNGLVPCNLGNNTMNTTINNVLTPINNYNAPNTNNNAVTGITLWNSFNIDQANESLANFLGSPLIHGQNYILSFWALSLKGSKDDPFSGPGAQAVNQFGVPAVLQFAGSNQFVPTTSPVFPINSLEPIASVSLGNTFNAWKNYTVAFTYTSSNTSNANLLMVGFNGSATNLNYIAVNSTTNNNTYLYYVFLDDISIKAASQYVSLNIPNNGTLCAGKPLLNLAQYASIPTGTFSGSGVTTTNTNTLLYNFNSAGTLAPGSYIITYTYIDNLGCIQNISKNLSIVPNTANATIGYTPATTCNGGATLSVISPTANLSYTWQPNQVNSISCVVYPLNNTIYTVTAVNPSNCVTGSVLVVPLISSPTLAPIYNSNCSTGTLTVNGNYNSYNWQPINQTTSVIVVSPTTTAIYTVVVTNSAGCTASNTIMVVPPFPTTINIQNPTPTICRGSQASLSVNSSSILNINTINWMPGGFNTNSIVVSPSVTTIYTISLNSISGCSASYTTQISVIGSAFNLSFPQNSLCPFTVLTVTANGISAVTWQPGSTVSNTLSIPAGTGLTYSAIANYSNLCILTQTFQFATLDIWPNYNLQPILPGMCAGVSQNLSLIGQPTFTAINWQPGNYNTATIAFTPTAITIFTINFTTATGCLLTKTLSVIPSFSCCTNTLTSVSEFSSSVVNLAGSNAVNFYLIVKPSQTINVSGELLFAPNAIIDVKPGGVLNLNTAHLYACRNGMWDGIYLSSGATFSSTPNTVSNLVEDAKIAVNIAESPYNGMPYTSPATYTSAAQPPICKISNTIFNKNLIGISIANFPIPTSNNYNFMLNSSVFTCRNISFNSAGWPQAITSSGGLRFASVLAPNTLSSPYLLSTFTVTSLKPPYAGRTSQAGIYLERVGTTHTSGVVYAMSIGDASTPNNFNIFDAQTIGIDAKNSHVWSYNNVFQNTQYYNAIGPNAAIRSLNNLASSQWPYGGYHVDLNDPKLDLVAPTNPTACINKFYDCQTGVYAQNVSTVNIRYAQFSSAQTNANASAANSAGYKAIDIVSQKFDNYQIHSNKFMNINIGVNCVMMPNNVYNGSTAFNIYGERWGTFSVTANYFSCASATNALPGSGYYMGEGIRFTSVLNAGQAAFYAKNPNLGINIKFNNFDRVQCGIYLGSMASNNYTKTVEGNVISLRNSMAANPTQWGIRSDAGKYLVVKTNTVLGTNTLNTNLMTGIYSNLNQNSAITCNSVTTLPRGFDLGGAHTPTLIWNGNTMNNNGYGMKATAWGTGITSGIGFQGTAQSPRDNKWMGTWNSSSNLQTWTDQFSSAAGSKYFGKTFTGTSPTFSCFITPSLNTGFYPIQSFNSQSNSQAVNSNSLSSCNTNSPNTGGGCLWCRPAQVDSVYEDGTEIANFILFMNLSMDSVALANNDTLAEWYTDNLPDKVGQIMEIENALAIGDYQNAQSLIDAFNPETNIQNNFKTYFQVYHNYRVDTIIIIDDNSALLYLANQCPFTDGPAVYKARALYDLINNTAEIYNDDNCVPEGYSMRQGHNTENVDASLIRDLKSNETKKQIFKDKNVYLFYPNPAKDSFTIKGNIENEKIQIIITDVSGRQLLNQSTQFNNFKTKMGLELYNGIYFVTIITSKSEILTRKLIISN